MDKVSKNRVVGRAVHHTELPQLALEKRSVVHKVYSARGCRYDMRPAAWVMQMPYAIVIGMKLYLAEKPQIDLI